jgi:hypothetical protein
MNRPSEIDRRKSVPMRELLMNVLTSVIVGLLAGAAGVYVAVKQIELKIQYLQRDLDGLLILSKEVDTNRGDMQAVKIWMQNSDFRISKIERTIDRMNEK